MSIKYDKYMPLYAYLSPASIPQIVAHIQDYLVKHPILSVETIAEIIVQSLQEHPELINGTAIPISADSEQSIKAYIDSLPSVDTYTKAEINTLLTGKQDTLTFDQAPTPGSSNPVTSSGIIAAMSAMNEALETLINAKADSASTYTKTQVDTLLTDKANTDDVYSKNTMDAKLLEYATSDSVYSKTDINTIKQVNKANLAIVSTDGTAPLDIAAGQYVYYEDVMYMATEDILTGARLVPNSNIVLNPIGVTNRIGDGLKNAVTQINGLADRMTLAEGELSSQSQQIANVESGIAIIVNGDTATQAVPAGGYAYIKNNTHGLSEGLYTNTSGAAFPASGGTADNTVFTAVSNGGFNVLNSKIATQDISSNVTTPRGTFTIKQVNTVLDAVFVTVELTLSSEVNAGQTILTGLPKAKGNYVNIFIRQGTTPKAAYMDNSGLIAGEAFSSGAKLQINYAYVKQ